MILTSFNKQFSITFVVLFSFFAKDQAIDCVADTSTLCYVLNDNRKYIPTPPHPFPRIFCLTLLIHRVRKMSLHTSALAQIVYTNSVN